MGFVRKRRGVAVAIAVALLAAGCTSSKGFGVGSAGGSSGGSTTAQSGGSTTAPAAQPGVPSTSTAPTPPLPPQPAVVWHACNGVDGPAGDGCGTVTVPLDYTNPTGRKIGIAVARHQASGAKIGSLLVNPGGPGASGIEGLEDLFVALFPSSVLARFDVVAFDPRGVGRSAPIRCLSPPQLDQFFDLDPVPANAAGFQTLVTGSHAFAQGCQAMSGSLLPFVGTVSAARDIDQIRQAVGDAKLTYAGFSYGTFLGATYAELFPANIRAMVLDGAENPALDPVTTTIDQAAAFDKDLSDFFAWCAANATCSWRPAGDLRSALNALIAKIRAQRLPGIGARTLGPGEAYIGVVNALYDTSTWALLGDVLKAAGAGDGSGLLSVADDYTHRAPDGTYPSNLLEANSAINCVDNPWPRDPNTLLQDTARARQQAPVFGVFELYSGLPCALWPTPPTGHPHPIKAAGSPPIVVVGSTGDPATPYADAQALAGQLEHGVLLTRVGDGHTGYRSSACIRTAVDAYLLTAAPPATGLSCPTP